MSRTVAVVGAGLAGAAAAAAAHEAGATVVVVEARDRVGGASAESAGWIWRYRDLRSFARLAPAGDRAVQRAIVDGLDDCLEWLGAHGIAPLRRGTGREQTIGARYDAGEAVERLLDGLLPDAVRLGARVGSITPAAEGRFQVAGRGCAPFVVDAFVLAGGGFGADLDQIARASGAAAQARRAWYVRPRHGGDGSAQRAAKALGGSWEPLAGACFVRIVPELSSGTSVPGGLLRAFGELTVPGTDLLLMDGSPLPRLETDWSGAVVGWELARTSGRGWLRVPVEVLAQTTHAGSVAEVVAEAVDAGAECVREPDGALRIRIVAGITHTLGGFEVAPDGAVRGGPPGMFAAGCDARGAGAGGMASGLAQALVLGRAAGCAAARIRS